jgi:DNA-directed RNA polymerase subunit F
MTAPEIISFKPIDMVTLKDEIEKIKKRDKEVNIRVGKVEEYLGAFPLISKKDASEMFDKLTDLKIPRVREMHIYKIIDVMPFNLDELKVCLSGYPITVTADNLKKIIKVVDEYRK